MFDVDVGVVIMQKQMSLTLRAAREIRDLVSRDALGRVVDVEPAALCGRRSAVSLRFDLLVAS